ncbi:MAG: hypothetical protein Kow0025_12010 [Thermodesulfovibrionales bacterium]
MDFEQVENKILERLRAEVPHLMTLETYAGQLGEDIGRLPVRFPAAYVIYGGSRFEPIDGPGHEEEAKFSVLVAARAPRGGGGPGQGGAYGLVKDVLSALSNSNLGLDMERLRPLRVALVHTSPSVTVYGVDFRASFDGAYGW